MNGNNLLYAYQPDAEQLSASVLKRKRSSSTTNGDGLAEQQLEILGGSKALSVSPATAYGEEVSTPATTASNTTISVEIPYVPQEQSKPAKPKASTSKSVKGKGKATAPKKQARKPAAKKQSQKARTKASDRLSRTATPEYFEEDQQLAYQPQRAQAHAYDPEAAPVDSDEEDDRLYCICQRLYDPERMMIACDRCDDWYHTDCIGIDEGDVELVNDFICPSCESQTDKRTTWKSRCLRENCNKGQISLSKYCSDWCGIEAAAARLDISGIPPQSIWQSVAKARKRGGVVLDGNQEITRTSSTSPQVNTQTDREAEEASKLQLEQLAIQAEQKAVARELQHLQISLSNIAIQRSDIEAHVALIDSRLAYLQLAIKNWDAAVHAHALSTGLLKEGDGIAEDAALIAKIKKSKKKQPAAGPSNEAPCGFDVRLIWDDNTWATWATSRRGRAVLAGDASVVNGVDHDMDAASLEEEEEEELGLVCTITRKRCDRHHGWQRLNEASFEAEKTALLRKLETMTTTQIPLQERLTDIEQYSVFLTTSSAAHLRSLEQSKGTGEQNVNSLL